MAKSLLRVNTPTPHRRITAPDDARALMVQHYEEHLCTTTNRNNRPYDPGTIRSYMRCTRMLAEWLDNEAYPGDLTAACAPAVLNLFLRHYLSGHDVNGTAFVQRSLRALFVWLEGEADTVSPFRSRDLDTYTARVHKPKVLSREFVLELLDSCKGTAPASW